MSSELAIRIASSVGVCVAVYALYVERQMAAAEAAGEEYEAPCDIKKGRLKGASCTAVFSSDYGHILSYWKLVDKASPLDFSNAALAIVFYAAMLAHDLVLGPESALLLFAAALGGLLFSAYLGYILKFVLKDFCVVCTSMYAVNLALFVIASVRLAHGYGFKLFAASPDEL